MSGEDLSSYAPKSPDLSSFFPADPTPANQQQQQQHQPAPPPLSLDNSYSPPAGAAHRQQSSSQQYQPPRAPNTNPYQQHPLQPQHHQSPPTSSYVPPQAHVKSEFPPQSAPLSAHQSYAPPNPHHLPPQSAYHQPQHSGYPHTPYGQPYGYSQGDPYSPASGAPGGPYASSDPYAAQHLLGPGGEMPTRRAAAAAAAAATSAQMSDEFKPEPDSEPMLAAPPAPVSTGIIEPSPVKTKFPTARIKRIMQADEEVGKVAQQTPIAVGKALEMFMCQLVTKSAEVAKEKGSKRVTAPMLKQVVETDDQWDFLREIVGKVEHEKEGAKSKAKAESESDEDSFAPKKKARGGRKKKEA